MASEAPGSPDGTVVSAGPGHRPLARRWETHSWTPGDAACGLPAQRRPRRQPQRLSRPSFSSSVVLPLWARTSLSCCCDQSIQPSGPSAFSCTKERTVLTAGGAREQAQAVELAFTPQVHGVARPQGPLKFCTTRSVL